MHWRAAWLRWLGFVAFLVATPIAQQLVPHVAALIEYATDDGCPDCAKDDGAHRDCCPGPCQACRCCAQPTILAIVRHAIVSLSGPPESIGPPLESLYASGYSVPPFRPPTV